MKMLMPKGSSLSGRRKWEEAKNIVRLKNLKRMEKSFHIYYGMYMSYSERIWYKYFPAAPRTELILESMALMVYDFLYK